MKKSYFDHFAHNETGIFDQNTASNKYIRIMSNVANKRNMSGAIPKKKGDPSSNRISKKSQFYTLRRYYQSFKKKSDIMVQRSWACVFSLDLALTDWDRYCLGCRPPLTV